MAEIRETQPLLTAGAAYLAPEEIDITSDRVYAKRYWVLALFSLLAVQQSGVWFTFATVSNDAKEFYKISSHDIDLLAMWGPITFCLTVPLFTILLSRSIRTAVLLAISLEVLATFIRANFAKGPESVIFLHIGAILNASVGCVTMVGPPQLRYAKASGGGLSPLRYEMGKVTIAFWMHALHVPMSNYACSAIWFDTNERARATSVSALSGIAGGAVMFLMCPELVQHFGMREMLAAQQFSAICLWVLIIIPGSFPEGPPTPPAASAHIARLDVVEAMRTLLSNRDRSFWIACVAGGAVAGVYAGWSTVLPLILAPEPWRYTEKVLDVRSLADILGSSAWLGFFSVFAGMAGAFFVGCITDWLHRYRTCLFVFLSLAAVLFTIWSVIIAEKLEGYNGVILGLNMLGSFFLNGCSPLFYELTVELTYPVPEAVSACFLTLMNNLGCLLLQLIGYYGYIERDPGTLNWVLTGTCVVCGSLVLAVRENYRRLDVDIRARRASAKSIGEYTGRVIIGDHVDGAAS